jgi:hypothetical protein
MILIACIIFTQLCTLNAGMFSQLSTMTKKKSEKFAPFKFYLLINLNLSKLSAHCCTWLSEGA